MPQTVHATVVIREYDGTLVYNLGPVDAMDPFHRWAFHWLYLYLGFDWVYCRLWNEYRRRSDDQARNEGH